MQWTQRMANPFTGSQVQSKSSIKGANFNVPTEALHGVERIPSFNLIRQVAGNLLSFLRTSAPPPVRLALLHRVALGPKQALVLVEADGFRLLVATSPEGSTAFFPLSRIAGSGTSVLQSARSRDRSGQHIQRSRISW